LDDRFFHDVDAALVTAGAREVRVIFCLLDFKLCAERQMVNGAQLGGHSDCLIEPRKRQALLDGVVAPILERYGRNEIIEAWDLFNEPDWICAPDPVHLAPSDLGQRAAAWLRRLAHRHTQGDAPPDPRVPTSALRDFLARATDAVHQYTGHFATVGSASNDGLALVRDLGLDLFLVHWAEA